MSEQTPENTKDEPQATQPEEPQEPSRDVEIQGEAAGVDGGGNAP